MTLPADGHRSESTVAAAALGMAEPLLESDHRPQHANYVILDVEALTRAAEAETTRRLASPNSGERRGHENIPEESGRPTAAPAASEDAVHDPLEDRITREIQEVRRSRIPPCIWRVHPSIREQESKAYEPKLVSIGPLHRRNKSLRPMEEIKLRYLNDLLCRSPENELGNYIREIRLCEARARMQYAEEVEPDVDEFVRMLVIDGCFIIEYFVKRVLKQTQDTAQLSGVRWGLSHLRRDLMLLENQIPFFVLVKLFAQSTIPFRGTRPDPLTLMEITLAFLKVKLPRGELPDADQVLHLLHLHHLCLNPTRVTEERRRCSFGQVVLYPFKKATSLVLWVFIGLLYLLLVHKWPWRCFPTKTSEVPRMIPGATELDGAGIKFKKKVIKKGGVDCYLKVSFREGTLQIPLLPVQESTSSELRNFIALEQCCPKVGSHFTSYAVFMDNIINTEGDVAILRKRGIIESKLGSDEEVAKMFNTLCKGTHLDYKHHYNASLFKEVKGYCELTHHRWRAILVRNYFSHPWSIISLVAGVLLLCLAAAQTYFTIFPRK